MRRQDNPSVPGPPYGTVVDAGLRRQRSEQYLTCSQSRSHFLRHVKGKPQWAQVFTGSSDFLRIFMGTIVAPSSLPALPEPMSVPQVSLPVASTQEWSR